MRKRLLAAMPMIAFFLFLLAGLYLKNWALGWSFLLLIPLSTMLLTGNFKKRVSESIPLFCLVVFLWIGIGTGVWNPTWLIFLLIPLVNIINDGKINARKLVEIAITAIYIGIGLYTGEWNPTWMSFLLIPIINTLFFPQRFAYINFSSSDFKKKFKDVINQEDE